MFSPLNIIIRPSRYKRWLFFSVHILALISVVLSQLYLFVKILIAMLVCYSAFRVWRTLEPSWMLHWNLDERTLSIAKNDQPFQECVAIRQLYLVFGLLHLRIEREPNKYLDLLIFPDSVDKQSLRRLRVSARWGNLKPKDN